jgi:hypothetical protein
MADVVQNRADTRLEVQAANLGDVVSNATALIIDLLCGERE